MKPFLDSTDVAHEGDELRQRMARDGYLFVRGAVPAEVLEEMRLSWLELLRDAGCVDASAPLDEGLADLSGFRVEPADDYMNVLVELYRKPTFQAIQHHPDLVGLVERMVGETVLPHPRVIARYIFPEKTEFTTPPHQDWIPIQGTAETYTVWIPFADMPLSMGGLQICAGSHKNGIYKFRPALGAGGLEISDELPDNWCYNPLQQGDVILFHSLTVHKGMPCTGKRLRLSMDARYQGISQPVSPGSLEPHCCEIASWEQLYADWPDDTKPYRYYWKKYDLKLNDYDVSYHVLRDDLAFEMAEAGDVRAYSTLQRIVARDKDENKCERAELLMKQLRPTN